MGAGNYGGFGNTSGSMNMSASSGGSSSGGGNSTSKPSRVKFPRKPSQVKHIFRNKPGHLTDTPYHRQVLRDLANDSNHYKGKDANGNSWHVKIMKDGSQLWVQHRNGIIQNGGKNIKPRKWNNKKGLNKPIKNTMKKKKGGKK